MKCRRAGTATIVTAVSAIRAPPRINHAARLLLTRSASKTSGSSIVAVVRSRPGTWKSQSDSVRVMKSAKKSASSCPTMKSGRGSWFRTCMNE